MTKEEKALHQVIAILQKEVAEKDAIIKQQENQIYQLRKRLQA